MPHDQEAPLLRDGVQDGAHSASGSVGRRSRGPSVLSEGSLSRAGHGRKDNVVNVVSSVLGDSEMLHCCGCGWSRPARTLMVSFVLFTTITGAQVAGALIAHSMALLADCASMGLDAITYAFNIYAECRQEPDPRRRLRNELIASGISYACLIGISGYFLHDGITSIIDKSWEDGGDDVNAYIVFGFAVAGILFDVLSLVPYILYGCPCMKKAEDDEVGGEQMNLLSALMHVSADLMRSVTTFIESLLIWAAGINGDKADSYATVIVTATIVLGAIKPVYEWALGVRAYLKDEPGDDEDEEGSPAHNQGSRSPKLVKQSREAGAVEG
eukprot:TRINITY_DN12954_c0_g1_i1.p1 TRINITY_DN12954_c0_g1~~TRINITY_DN12954_c0_g1_i1.p1  ORF type:complete len:353 (+),score=117.35 TRINITY_DN12954_c0_g1_i1:81-1061(+)